MTAVMKLQRQQVQPPQTNVGFGGRGRSYGQMDRYGMGMGPMGMGAPCDAMGYGGRGGGRMGNMGRGEECSVCFHIKYSLQYSEFLVAQKDGKKLRLFTDN